jgi:hypothetical protein
MTEMEEGKEDWATYFCVINMPQFFNPLRANFIYKVKDQLNELLCKELAIWVTKNSSKSKLECTLCLGGWGEGGCVQHLANILLIHKGLGNHHFPHLTSCWSEKIKSQMHNVSPQNHTCPVDELHN